MDIVNYNAIADKKELFEVLQQLRSHLTYLEFTSLFRESEKEGFQLFALIEDELIRAVMGLRIIHDFTHGKHLYVDDLVTRVEDRSKGYGKQMLDFAQKLAKDNECQMVRLCSGIDREAAHRFYQREGWLPKSMAFKKKL